MADIGNIAANSTANATAADVRDRFIDVVAAKNEQKKTDTKDWATDKGINDKNARDAVNTEAGAEGTVQARGEKLWDANAGYVKAKLADLTYTSGDETGMSVYDSLTDEQKATLDLAANVMGPTAAAKLFSETYEGFEGDVDASVAAGIAALADKMKGGWKGLLTSIDAIDGEVSIYDVPEAAVEEAEPADRANEVVTDPALTPAQNELKRIDGAATELLNARNALNDKVVALNALVANPNASAAELQTAKDGLEALNAAITANGDAIVALTADLTKVDVETDVSGVTNATVAAKLRVDPLPATPTADAIDKAIAAAAYRDEVAAPFSLEGEYDVGAALTALKNDEKEQIKSESYRGEHNVPETWIRMNYGTIIDPDGKKLTDVEIKKYMKDHSEEVAKAYVADMVRLVTEKLKTEGYSDAQLAANMAAVQTLIEATVTGAHSVKDGKDKVAKARNDELDGITYEVPADALATFIAAVPHKTVNPAPVETTAGLSSVDYDLEPQIPALS